MAEIIYLPISPVQTQEQRDYWFTQAAYWAEHEDIAQRAVEYANRQRENALRMLGMLGVERGLGE